MKFLPLVWKTWTRKKVRTTFTLLCILISFILFGALTAVRNAFTLGIDLAGLDRLITIHKVSIIQPLPISYLEKLRAVEGVEQVTFAVWFGGIYQDPKNQFGNMAVNPEGYFDMYPELLLPEEQKQAWIANRTGAVVGRATADRFGWEVGDRIPLQATIWRNRDDSPWEFTIEGIYDGAEKGTDTTNFFFHYDYLKEGNPGVDGIVGWYMVKISEPDRAVALAEDIDSRFANSPAETKTTTEKAFVQSFANQIGNISKIVLGIVSVVFFTLLLVAGNTMAQSVRERTSELAVLKTLGFSDGKVLGLVLAESLFLALLGGGIGLGLVAWFINTQDVGGAFLPALYMPTSAIVIGAGLVLLLGLVAGFVPALQAMRLNIVDALRRS